MADTATRDGPLELVIYGDFNCPFSALASERARSLEAAGRAIIDWRAIEHDPAIPRSGSPVDALRREDLQREIDVVHGLLTPDESLPLRVPAVVGNTATLNRRYAAFEPRHRPEARRRFFRAYWWTTDEDESTTDPPATADGAIVARRWQAEWSRLERPIVPAMVLPDGAVSRGLGVLARLAAYAVDSPHEPSATGGARACVGGSDHEGGDAPCWAHLV